MTLTTYTQGRASQPAPILLPTIVEPLKDSVPKEDADPRGAKGPVSEGVKIGDWWGVSIRLRGSSCL